VPRIQLPADNPLERQFLERAHPAGFGITMATILLPVVLMLIGGWANLISTPGSGFNQFLLFIGNSVIALAGDLAEFLDPGHRPGLQP
jgi:GntP family gluconate:H+ symporter